MTTRVVHWRDAADPDDLREYDAFGPWIYPVQAEAEMPRRFREHYPVVASAALVLKIPRDFDRAQVRPGDDLYHSVLAVFDDRICWLHAEVVGAGMVERTDVRVDQVVGISTQVNLLRATWTLLLRDGSRIAVPHSATSSPLMDQVTGHLRERIAGSPRTLAPVEFVPPSDHLFAARVLLWSRTLGAAQPLLVDPRNVPCRRSGRGWLQLSTGAMILFTPTELVIVNRGEATRPVFLPNYAVGTVELPYDQLDSFSVQEPPRWSSFHELVLRAGSLDYVQPSLGAPDAVADQLRRLGIPG
jgi:hypothetical protein